ncbi:MAG: hypothetical protein L6416_00900 [Candidatus Omnitrophica bacterium]|nr:hypothetical protein [Candidatus Omnitrophota bacterium]
MKKRLKIISVILIQTLLLPYGALAEGLYERADLAAVLSPKLQLQVGIYQKSFQLVLDETVVSAVNAGSFDEYENILHKFGASLRERDFSRQDIYIAAAAILDKLYSDKKAAKNYIPIFTKNAADKKLKILSIALFIELFKSAEFYNKDVLNVVTDKIMKESFIRPARHQMATANFHYYVNPKNPKWVEMLWISILHELGHNIRSNMVNDKEKSDKSRQIASINEFFADLCPYIVSIEKNWVSLILILKEDSRRKHEKSKRANNGVLIDPHLASHAQWYRLLRGVNIYSLRKNLPKLIAIFHAALSKKYSNTKIFIEWIYQVNGLGEKLQKIMHELPKGKVSHGVEEIILADFSINGDVLKIQPDSSFLDQAEGVLRRLGIRTGSRVVSFGPGGIKGFKAFQEENKNFPIISWEWLALYLGAEVVILEPRWKNNQDWKQLAESLRGGRGSIQVMPPSDMTIQEAKIKPGTVDAVVMMSFLSDPGIPDWEKQLAMRQAIKMLRIGGHLIIGWYNHMEMVNAEKRRTMNQLRYLKKMGYDLRVKDPQRDMGSEPISHFSHDWIAYKVTKINNLQRRQISQNQLIIIEQAI